MIVLNDP
jgi:cytochrome P450